MSFLNRLFKPSKKTFDVSPITFNALCDCTPVRREFMMALASRIAPRELDFSAAGVNMSKLTGLINRVKKEGDQDFEKELREIHAYITKYPTVSFRLKELW